MTPTEEEMKPHISPIISLQRITLATDHVASSWGRLGSIIERGEVDCCQGILRGIFKPLSSFLK